MKSLALLLAILATPIASVFSGEPVFVGTKTPSDLVAIDKFDHDDWTQLLQKHVDEKGRVDYRTWKASSPDREALRGYLDRLSAVDPKLPTRLESKLAFWINAYNALTIEGILRTDKLMPIRDHTTQRIGYDIWDDLRLHVGAKAYSLNQIEHEVLRKLDEPRIHFAIVCASESCPPLRNTAYAADEIETQLSSSAKTFFSSPRNFELDGEQLRLSPLLDWFSEDFGATENEMLQRITPWLPEASQERLRARRWSVKMSEYDWSLNEQPMQRKDVRD